MLWKMGVIDAITGSDGHTRRALVTITKSNSLIKPAVNLVCPIEYKESMNVEPKAAKSKCNQRPARREATITGELKPDLERTNLGHFFRGECENMSFQI